MAMVNQQLKDYINQQRSSGVADQELRKRLMDSGWNEEDVNTVLGTSNLESVSNVKEYQNLDLSSPGIYDLGLAKTAQAEIKPPDNVSVHTAQTVQTESKSKNNKGINKAFVVLLVLALLAAVVVVYRYVNGSQTAISPEVGLKQEDKAQNVPASSKLSNPGMGIVDGVFTNTEAGFTLKPPTGWSADTSGAFGTLVVFTNNEFDQEGENKYTANMNIVVETTGQTLAEYIEVSKNSLAQNFSNHTLISETPSSTGEPEVILESTYDQGVFRVHNMQLVKVTGGKAYVVTAAAVESSWEKYKPIFDEALGSFTLK